MSTPRKPRDPRTPREVATTRGTRRATAKPPAAKPPPANPEGKEVPPQRSGPGQPSGTGSHDLKRPGRTSLTPQERAKRPVTSTIAAYVEWLDRTVYDGKLSGPQREVAGMAITLYGAYQTSPERRAARGV